MLKGRSAVAILLALGLVLGGSSLALTQEKPPARPGGGRGGEHPHIHMAMRALHRAAEQLEQAPHDFGGHRAKALALIRQADKELQEALAYAKAKPPKAAPAAPAPAPAPKTQ